MKASDHEAGEGRDLTELCPLCGQGDSERVYESLSTLRRCIHCGHAYTAPFRPGQRYGESYFRGEEGAGSYDFLGAWGRLFDKVRFPLELRHIRKYAASGKVLDLGCGVGHFMQFMHGQGYEPYGLDVSGFAVDFVEKELGFPVVQGGFDSVPPEWGAFRVLTLHHVLEHVPDPVSCLARYVRPRLQEEGIAVIEVPNFGSIDSRVEGADWEDLKTDQHASHFTVATLRECVARAGMKVVESYTYSPESHRLMWYYPYGLRLLGVPQRVHKRFPERAGPAEKKGPAEKRRRERRGYSNDHEAPPVLDPLPPRGQRGHFKRFLSTLLRLGTAPLASTYCALGLGKFIVLIAREDKADSFDFAETHR